MLNRNHHKIFGSLVAVVFLFTILSPLSQVIAVSTENLETSNSMEITFVQAKTNDTYDNLYVSVLGETDAAIRYQYFADRAEEEGYLTIANLFRATADAETKHADDEWKILQDMGATERPMSGAFIYVGSTRENLQAAIDGETHEYTVMYPEFLETAQKEGNTDAARIFRLAMKAEEVHANNYKDALANLQDADYLNEKYDEVYRCVVCGEVVVELPDKCPICGALDETFISYKTSKNFFNGITIVLIATIVVILALIVAALLFTKKRNK
jgi:rubrerythrin